MWTPPSYLTAQLHHSPSTPFLRLASEPAALPARVMRICTPRPSRWSAKLALRSPPLLSTFMRHLEAYIFSSPVHVAQLVRWPRGHLPEVCSCAVSSLGSRTSVRRLPRWSKHVIERSWRLLKPASCRSATSGLKYDASGTLYSLMTS